MPPGKRDPPAFLIFIKGRWRSLPPGSAFAVARRGRLAELHSGTVHGELRRLQLRLPSKARLGPRLSFKKIPRFDVENSDKDVTLTEPKQITLNNRDHRPCKRTRDSTSSEEPIQCVTTVATVHATKQCNTAKNHQSKELMESPEKSTVSSRILLGSPKRNLSLRRKPVEQTNLSNQNPILKSKYLSEKQISRYLQQRSGKLNENPKKRDAILSDSDFETDQSEILKPKMKTKHSPKKKYSISDSEFDTKNEKSSSKNQNKFHKIGPKRQKLNHNTSGSESPKQAENIFQRPDEECQTENPYIGTCKELEIGEQAIELLRIFIQNHYSDRELLKFDMDDEYKRMIFYRINPLVNIEWCPIIDRMLHRTQDQNSQITLTDFASNLGLQSVEAASIKTQRYKRTEKSYVDSDSDSSSEDKENNGKMPKRIEKTKILKEREHNMRESNTRDNKAKESKDKVSNNRVLTRKRAGSYSEESNAKYNNKAGIVKTNMTRTNHNNVESDSENNKNAEKAKERAKTEDRNTVESDSEASSTKENNNKLGISKERTTKANHNTVESDSEASNANENNKKVSNAKKPTKRDNRNSDDSDSRKSNTKRVDQKEIDNTVDTVELSSESETQEAVKAIKKKAKPKPVISSKGRFRSNLEYSTLEDHAIVAWVSTGSRASRVNGNLLWKQLQEQYKQITGSRRTWHSLRNRYLRYILPKLGDLALPLSQQARLRAAAATGEIKGRKVRSPRRNSIFTLPPRGAASRRPAGNHDDTEIDNEDLSPNRSPRYSSLTRRFTRRHNMTRPSSELSDTSQRSNKLEVPTLRKEKSEPKGNSAKKPYRAIDSPQKQTSGKTTRNAHSDSDRRSESPRQDNDSSDSSSESEDESKETNEPRRTRRSVNDADKRMSGSDTGQNATESKRRLTRQSNILDGSDESKSRKYRDVADKHNARDTAKQILRRLNESPKPILNRHKSPSEQTSRDSSDSMSQSRRKLSVNNKRRSRLDTKNRDESADESNKSKRRQSSSTSNRRSPTRKLNRNKSPSKQSSKGSNTSVTQVRRISKSPIKRKNTRHDSSSEENDSSSESVSEPRRKSYRINSPNDRSNRRRSNRLISPMKQNGRRLSSDLPRRKSNQLTPNESSNKRRHSSESKRKSKFPKRDSSGRYNRVASDSSESFKTKKIKKDSKKKVDQPKKTVNKQKMRRLFNPKTML